METSSKVGSQTDIEQGVLVILPQYSNEDDDDRRMTSSCSFSTSEKVVDQEGSGGEAEAVVVTVEDRKASVNLGNEVEKDCRICQMSLDGSNLESGYPIELGCSCKDDLGLAHKHCAEAWFKIRGNKICEICGSNARNVVGMNNSEGMEQWSDANNATISIRSNSAEARHFWQGHRFLNFLLACMVFAFVISWLFHFNVPS